MFDNLSGLGYGLVTFAIIIGVGSIVLYNFGGTQGCQNSAYPNWDSATNVCYEGTNVSNSTSPESASYTNVNYLLGQMGTSGLAGWTPAIIAFSVGMLFLGSFFVGKGRRY